MECGARLLYSRNRGKGGKTYEYFFCIGKQYGNCTQPYHRLEDLERAVGKAYRLVSLDHDERAELRKESIARIREFSGASERAMDVASTAMGNLASQERKLLDAFYADSVSPTLFHSEQQRIRRERIAAERVKETLSGDLEAQESVASLGVALTDRPVEAYVAADEKSRALMNQGYFAAIYIDDGNLSDSQMTPVLEQLFEIWTTRHAGRRQRVRRKTTEDVASESDGTNARNPHAFWRGGSKVDVLVRAEGLEPPRC